MRPVVMHIHFWADIRNTAGSVEKVILSFAKHGMAWRHEIACCPAENNVTAPYSYEGVAVFPFSESTVANRILNKMLRLDAFTYPKLVSLINSRRPQVLHFHNRQERVDQLVKRLNYRPRVAVHYHRHFEQPVIPASADVLVYPSQATADYITSRSGTKVRGEVVFNPLSPQLLRHADSVSAPRARGETVTFLFGGGASPIKGGKELVKAFLRWAPEDARLILAGNGVDAWSINDPRISQAGLLSADDFLATMWKSDVVVMPSHNEPFGLIAQEAMLMRKLLVATHTGGLAEFVPLDGAVIVPPNDVDGLARGLAKAYQLCGDETELEQVTQRAWVRMLELHPENQVRQLEEKVYG